MFWGLVKIAIWALAGFAASRIMKTGMSLVWNVVLGIVGGAVGSVLVKLIGLNGLSDTNKLGDLLISIAGACLVIYLVRIVRPKLRK